MKKETLTTIALALCFLCSFGSNAYVAVVCTTDFTLMLSLGAAAISSVGFGHYAFGAAQDILAEIRA